MKHKTHSSSSNVIEGDIVSVRSGNSEGADARVQFHRAVAARTVSSKRKRRAAPPVVSILPEQAQAIIDAAESLRDRLLLMVLWQTGARISEALALTGGDIEPDALWLLNLKQHTERPDKRLVPLPPSSTLTAELALYQKAQKLNDSERLFVSRKGGPLSRVQAWRVVKQCSDRAGVTVRALRSVDGGQQRGDKVGVWSHVFRHSRAMQTPEWVAAEKARIPAAWFDQEYMCQFTENEGSFFAWDDVERAFRDDIEPLWPVMAAPRAFIDGDFGLPKIAAL